MKDRVDTHNVWAFEMPHRLVIERRFLVIVIIDVAPDLLCVWRATNGAALRIRKPKELKWMLVDIYIYGIIHSGNFVFLWFYSTVDEVATIRSTHAKRKMWTCVPPQPRRNVRRRNWIALRLGLWSASISHRQAAGMTSKRITKMWCLRPWAELSFAWHRCLAGELYTSPGP